MTGLYRHNPETWGGKYLVKRRDGSVPAWPNFVLGAKDPAAPAALMAYAAKAEELGLDQRLADDVRNLSLQFQDYRSKFGQGDPDAGPSRPDDPATVTELLSGINPYLAVLQPFADYYRLAEKAGIIPPDGDETTFAAINGHGESVTITWQHLHCAAKLVPAVTV